MRETILVVRAGRAVGSPSALLVSWYVSTLLFGVTPPDVGAAAAALVILAACARRAPRFIPARRAKYDRPDSGITVRIVEERKR